MDSSSDDPPSPVTSADKNNDGMLPSAEARLDAHIYYPVLTLPNEIVAHIFEHCLPAYPLRPPFFGPLSPAVLGQICHTWRDIAFSTPTLWRASSFVVSVKWTLKQRESALNKATKLLETWLARSGCCPLSIHLDDYTGFPIVPYVLALAPHLGHLEHLDLASGCALTLNHTPLRSQTPMPLLRSLNLGCDYTTYMTPTPATAFLNSPRLQSVQLKHLVHPSQIVLPWSQLTSLYLDSNIPGECLQILTQAVNLVHCALFLYGYSDDDSASRHINPLPRLESLEVFGLWTSFLPQLTLPALRSVKFVTLSGRSELGFLDHLLVCVARSGCSLQKLHIVKARGSAVTPDPDYILCGMKFPSVDTIR
ncbi:hypothetical protein DFH06DRAFT_1195500 [Mycena polygramma]|nr:hypothetical protein DFH06DRAFT_1195500 [Mycena polygramma]